MIFSFFWTDNDLVYALPPLKWYPNFGNTTITHVLWQFSTRVRLGDEELSFVEEFRYLGHIMTADCRDDKDIKKQFRRQNAVGNMLVRKFSFAPIEAKIQLFVILLPIYGCALWHHSFQNSIRELTVHYSDTFKCLINVPTQIHQLESGICDERNWPYQCGVPQIYLQLDEQSKSFLQQYCHCHCQ